MVKKKSKKITEESFRIDGAHLIEKVKELIHQGNVRRITILDKSGKEIIRFPVTLGVIGTALVPVLAAVGAMAALITECTITVEKEID